MMSPFIGEVRGFAFRVDPENWLLCDGQLYPTSERYFTALFALIGNRFGGDGRYTFAVPDFRGYAPMGAGEERGLTHRKLGDKTGAATILASAEHFPPHTHSVCVSTDNATTGSGDNASLAIAGVDAGPKPVARDIYAPASGSIVKMGEDAMTKTSSTNTPHNNMQPYLPMFFYICYSGTYPSRP